MDATHAGSGTSGRRLDEILRTDGESESRLRGPSGPRGKLRSKILATGRQEFAARGYEGVTMREISRLAGCDAAMITYYFGSKYILFRECFNLPLDPARDMLELLLPDVSTAGERIVRHALELYEERITGEALKVLMRSIVTDRATMDRFLGYMRSDVLGKIAAHLGGGEFAYQQIELAMAQIYGIVTMRYLIRLEPLCSMPFERVVAEVAPFVQIRINRIVQNFARSERGTRSATPKGAN